MIYLASPYTHDDPAVRQWRYEQACKAVAILHGEGTPAISPIAMCHGVALHGDMSDDWQQWQYTCDWLLSDCDEMIILCLPGWDESVGIKAEILIADSHGVPVDYMDWKGKT